eukprot:CAMPEP_0170380796 /NCGR_PEP_ID=MMETSP0117_2-20130122/14069_1 /TAXON_ID=400756 /ORGANISM="Durinskia baltica, Strain CSIRO CS-38" /LENGTH=661 /DNA_ID=CAMNT_0010636329 /DNA_START=129 /DNA_END=2114 /DNA_ORIENTATION=+
MTLFASLTCLLAVTATVHSNFIQKSRRIPRESFVKQQRAIPDENHALIFAVKQKNLDYLEKTLIERSTPRNELYQKWLTYDEIGEITSNSAGADAVRAWLLDNDVSVIWSTNHDDYIKAEAPVHVWEKLLNAEFYEFQDLSRNTRYKMNTDKILRADEYSLPAHMDSHLSAVFHTVQTPPEVNQKYHVADETEEPKKTSFRSDFTITRVSSPSNKATESNGVVTVQFLNNYYQIASNTASADLQQSVFETAQEHFSPNDLTQFQNTYGLPVQAAEAPFGYTTTNCNINSCYEGNLDIQYIMGLSQQTATVYWYQAQTGTSDPFVDWATDVANSTNPPLSNSISWGSTEQANAKETMNAFNTEAMKLGAMGVTVTVSSGDDGAAGDADYCDYNSGSAAYNTWSGTPWTGQGYFPSFPATSPYVTAVGATQGPEEGNPEIACQSNEGGVITTGGGFSTYNPTPSWQQDAVDAYFSGLSSSNTPTSGYNPNGRGYPDISMIGVKYQVVVQGKMKSVYGTSASSPVVAALVSLVNAARAANNQTSLGFINPTLYAYGMPNTLGVNGTNFQPFNDVTEGYNKCTAGSNPVCCDSGFYATSGWDPVTGFGSVFYPNFAAMFEVDSEFFAYDDDSNDGSVGIRGMLSAASWIATLATFASLTVLAAFF